MDLSQIPETQKAQNLSMKKEEINRSLNSKITTCANNFWAIFSQFSYKIKEMDKSDEKQLMIFEKLFQTQKSISNC